MSRPPTFADRGDPPFAPPFLPYAGAPEEPNELAFAAVLATCARRLAGVGLLWVGCAAVVWLWWPQWRADFARTEPWLAALSWWGEAAGIAWATGAILAGRLTRGGAGGRTVNGNGGGDRWRRWAVVGVLLSLALDFGLTMGGFVADRLADRRTVATFGVPLGADRVPASRGGGVDVRLRVGFLLPPDPTAPLRGRSHTGTTTVRVPPFARIQAALAEPAATVGPDGLSPPVALWAWLNAVGGANLPIAPPVAVRYDPAHPGRFWVGGQTWDRGAPSRFLLAMLPVLQAGFLLFHLGWVPLLPRAGEGWLPDLLARHLPLFPLVSEIVFLGLWGVMDAGWVI